LNIDESIPRMKKPSCDSGIDRLNDDPLLAYSTDLCFMRYHPASVLIIDPFGSILRIAAACCFEDSSGMQVSDGITKSWPVSGLCQGTIS
jgi:hypothetical protein